MKSSKWLVSIVLGCLTAGLYGCGDGLTDREETCLKATGNLQCKSKDELQIEAQRQQAQSDLQLAQVQAEVVDDQASEAEANAQMASAQANMAEAQPQNIDYGPVQPGNYTNYYGNPQYGQWLPNGQFQFFDPYSHAASSTNAFLLGAGLGGLTGYLATKAAMRSDWNRSNPRGWSSHSWKSDKYTYKGKVMSKNDALRRMEQSNRDRAANQAKLKRQLKQQQIQIQKQQHQLKNQYKKPQMQTAKKPNYMTQPRAPSKGFNLSKPVLKTASLKKAAYKPAKKSYFSSSKSTKSYKSSSKKRH